MKLGSRFALRLTKSFLLASIVSTGILLAEDEVLYKDSFKRTGDIQGTTPEVNNVTNAQWGDNARDSGAAGLVTNGSALIVDKLDLVALPTGSNELPDLSKITLSADLTNTGAWIGFGFSGSRNAFAETEGAVAWVQLWGNGDLKILKGHSGSEVDETLSAGIVTTPGQPVHIEITINTSTNEAKVTADGNEVGSFHYETIPPAKLIFVQGVDGSNGTVENLSLTMSPVTEPAAAPAK